MPSKLPISVHILTFNSEKTLSAALESVKHCEEILIIDGNSTDDTLNIAKNYGAKIVMQEKQKESLSFATIRNQAMKHNTKDWIFVLDSDEYASSKLMESIKNIIETNEPTACMVTRKYVLNSGKVVDFASTYPNRRLYFFHKNAIEKWIKPVHERPLLKANTKIKILNGECFAPIGSIEEYKEKNLKYLKIEAEKSHNLGLMHWLHHRVFHTIRSRIISMVRLANIWLIPHKGTKMPLKHEFVRFWYGWMLIWKTCPILKCKMKNEK